MRDGCKVLLVKPFLKKSFYTQNEYPPVGLGYLGESLESEGVGYEVMDMGLYPSIKDLYAKIKKHEPAYLGISFFTYQYKTIYNLISDIKSNFPKLKIIAGGPHISTFREKALRECKEIDFGVVLEGETALLGIVKERRPEEIKGIIYRDDGTIMSTGDPELTENLDDIGFPKYNKFELQKYAAIPKVMTIVTTRGCPYQCIYCPVGIAIGRKLRYRSPKSVAEEISYWYERGYRWIEMMDDNFTFKKDRVHEICDLIEKQRFKDVVFNIPNGVRADRVDRDLLRRLKSVGFKVVSFGVEAGNNKVLKNLKKGEDINTITQAIEWAIDAGLEARLFFLIGSPGESYSDFTDSLKLAQRYPVSDVYFYNIIPYPKTEIFDWIERNKYFLKKPDFYLNDISSWDSAPVFATPEMSIEERKKAYRNAKKVERQVYRNKIKNKLSKFGAFGIVFALIYSSSLVQWMLKNNSIFRRMVLKLKNNIRFQ